MVVTLVEVVEQNSGWMEKLGMVGMVGMVGVDGVDGVDGVGYTRER